MEQTPYFRHLKVAREKLGLAINSLDFLNFILCLMREILYGGGHFRF